MDEVLNVSIIVAIIFNNWISTKPENLQLFDNKGIGSVCVHLGTLVNMAAFISCNI